MYKCTYIPWGWGCEYGYGYGYGCGGEEHKGSY